MKMIISILFISLSFASDLDLGFHPALKEVKLTRAHHSGSVSIPEALRDVNLLEASPRRITDFLVAGGESGAARITRVRANRVLSDLAVQIGTYSPGVDDNTRELVEKHLPNVSVRTSIVVVDNSGTGNIKQTISVYYNEDIIGTETIRDGVSLSHAFIDKLIASSIRSEDLDQDEARVNGNVVTRFTDARKGKGTSGFYDELMRSVTGSLNKEI